MDQQSGTSSRLSSFSCSFVPVPTDPLIILCWSNNKMETYLVLQITKDSFPAIMKLPNLQELTLVGCIGIDDDALGSLEKECSKSLQVSYSW